MSINKAFYSNNDFNNNNNKKISLIKKKYDFNKTIHNN